MREGRGMIKTTTVVFVGLSSVHLGSSINQALQRVEEIFVGSASMILGLILSLIQCRYAVPEGDKEADFAG